MILSVPILIITSNKNKTLKNLKIHIKHIPKIYKQSSLTSSIDKETLQLTSSSPSSSSDFGFEFEIELEFELGESPPRNRFNDLSTMGGVEEELRLLELISGVL